MIESERKIKQVYVGVRLFMAGILVPFGVGCSISGTDNFKCPATAAEVSDLVGGNPENWRPAKNTSGAWIFESKVLQKLNGVYARNGRLGTASESHIPPAAARNATEAWYICINDSDGKLSYPRETLTPEPSR